MDRVVSGANNREIAERLVISEGTGKSHSSSILSQFGLRDRTQIAVFVHQQRSAGEVGTGLMLPHVLSRTSAREPELQSRSVRRTGSAHVAW